MEVRFTNESINFNKVKISYKDIKSCKEYVNVAFGPPYIKTEHSGNQTLGVVIDSDNNFEEKVIQLKSHIKRKQDVLLKE